MASTSVEAVELEIVAFDASNQDDSEGETASDSGDRSDSSASTGSYHDDNNDRAGGGHDRTRGRRRPSPRPARETLCAPCCDFTRACCCCFVFAVAAFVGGYFYGVSNSGGYCLMKGDLSDLDPGPPHALDAAKAAKAVPPPCPVMPDPPPPVPAPTPAPAPPPTAETKVECSPADIAIAAAKLAASTSPSTSTAASANYGPPAWAVVDPPPEDQCKAACDDGCGDATRTGVHVARRPPLGPLPGTRDAAARKAWFDARFDELAGACVAPPPGFAGTRIFPDDPRTRNALDGAYWEREGGPLPASQCALDGSDAFGAAGGQRPSAEVAAALVALAKARAAAGTGTGTGTGTDAAEAARRWAGADGATGFAAATAAALRTVLHARRRQLLDRYGGLERVLLGGSISTFSGARAIVAGKFARALVWRRPLVHGALGSSVTAGHDNYYNASWPAVLQRVMRPVARAAGITFTVRNAAQGGGESFAPAQHCIANAVGDDVDFVNWEWQYFGPQPSDQEVFIRSAAMLPKRPAVYFVTLHCVDEGGGRMQRWTPNDGDSNYDLGDTSNDPHELTDYYLGQGQHAVGVGGGQDGHWHTTFSLDEAGDGKEGAAGDGPSTRTAPWRSSPDPHAKDSGAVAVSYASCRGLLLHSEKYKHRCKEFGTKVTHKGTGRCDCEKLAGEAGEGHDDSPKERCFDTAGGNIGALGDGWNTGQVMVNWHPGPRGHEVIASAFAAHYLDAMLEALDLVAGVARAARARGGDVGAAVLAAFPDPDTPRDTPTRPGTLPLPPPLYIGPSPKKYPHAKGEKGVKKYRDAGTNAAPFAGAGALSERTATKCAFAFHPHVEGPSVADLLDNSTSAAAGRKWRVRQCPGDENWPASRRYVDYKFALTGREDAGWATFVLPGAVTGQAWVCEPPGDDHEKPRVMMWANTEWRVNGRAYTPRAEGGHTAAPGGRSFITRSERRCAYFTTAASDRETRIAAPVAAAKAQTMTISVRVKPGTKKKTHCGCKKRPKSNPQAKRTAADCTSPSVKVEGGGQPTCDESPSEYGGGVGADMVCISHVIWV